MQINAHYLTLPTKICIVVLFCVNAVIALPAQSIFFTTLANFDRADGSNPSGTLVQAADGDFYGTTANGGIGSSCCGTVFVVSPTGTLTAIYDFCSEPNCADGSFPVAGLVQAPDGRFSGTTRMGGNVGGNCRPNGCGTVFTIAPYGFTPLYIFCSQSECADGRNPVAPLVEAIDGNLYGTTPYGGNGYWGSGTVFEITPAGTLTTLYTFSGWDGAGPNHLVQATDGNFYGTTDEGGNIGNCTPNGCGTIFRFTQTGTLTTLYSFSEWDGEGPDTLVQATDGNFYGTTARGGSNGDGTVFKITPAGIFTTLHAFRGSDGKGPSGLVQARDGNLYGTTTEGGSGGGNCDGFGGCGTVFKITLSGTLTTLHSFHETDGQFPWGLMQALDGNFYGVTGAGGTYYEGTVFRLGVVHTCATCHP